MDTERVWEEVSHRGGYPWDTGMDVTMCMSSVKMESRTLVNLSHQISHINPCEIPTFAPMMNKEKKLCGFI